MANLSEKLRVNFTPKERARIEAAAAEDHRSVAATIRLAVLADLDIRDRREKGTK